MVYGDKYPIRRVLWKSHSGFFHLVQPANGKREKRGTKTDLIKNNGIKENLATDKPPSVQ